MVQCKCSRAQATPALLGGCAGLARRRAAELHARLDEELAEADAAWRANRVAEVKQGQREMEMS